LPLVSAAWGRAHGLLVVASGQAAQRRSGRPNAYNCRSIQSTPIDVDSHALHTGPSFIRCHLSCTYPYANNKLAFCSSPPLSPRHTIQGFQAPSRKGKTGNITQEYPVSLSLSLFLSFFLSFFLSWLSNRGSHVPFTITQRHAARALAFQVQLARCPGLRLVLVYDIPRTQANHALPLVHRVQ